MRILAIAVDIVLGLAAVSPCVGQAIAEGAMVHANSAAATAKAGSAWGNALSKAMSGNAQRIESLSAGKVEHVPYASGKSASGTPLRSGSSRQSSGPLVVTSIRGANRPCAAPGPKSAVSSSAPAPAKADAPQAPTQPAVPPAQDCATTTPPQSSKSVINLAFPK
jgi:hypothetical protein